jgi:AraC-like DNA-binding protein
MPAAGRIPRLDRIDAQAFLNAFPQSLPLPQGSVERLILQGLLLQFAGDCGMALHARVHVATQETDCPFVPSVFLDSFWRPRRVNPVDAFHEWANAFFKKFDEIHPLTAATRAAHVIRGDHRQIWDVARLAQRVHTTSSRLTRAFRNEYGMSVRDVQRRVRLIAALGRVRDDKIEPIALEAGYRSRKNFNRAFARVTGMTPTAFRALSHDRAQQIVDAAQARLSVPASTATRHQSRSQAARPQRAVAADRRRRRSGL